MKNIFRSGLSLSVAAGLIFSIFGNSAIGTFAAAQDIKSKIAACAADVGTGARVTVYVKTQADLDKYLSDTGCDMSDDVIIWQNNDDIVWPAGLYAATTKSIQYLFEPGYGGDIDFTGVEFYLSGENGFRGNARWYYAGDQKGRTIKGLKVVGTNDGNIATLEMNAGSHGFNQALYKAKNINFDSMTFLNTNNMSGHTFDIMGSDNVKITNSTFAGYGGLAEISDDEMTAIINSQQHRIGAEFVQIDSMYPGGAGWSNMDSFREGKQKKWWSVHLIDESDFDNTPSTNITVSDNYFGPYEGINGRGDQVSIAYGATVGSHYGNNYEGIRIVRNVFEKIIAPSKDSWEASNKAKNTDRFHYPIKMLYNSNANNIRDFVARNNIESNIFVDVRTDWKYPSGEPGVSWVGYYGSELETADSLDAEGLILANGSEYSEVYAKKFNDTIGYAGGLRATSVTRNADGSITLILKDGEELVWHNFGKGSDYLARPAVEEEPKKESKEELKPDAKTLENKQESRAQEKAKVASEVKILAPNTGFEGVNIVAGLAGLGVISTLAILGKKRF